MILVTVELISARTGKRSLLGKATICNNLHRTHKTDGILGDYTCMFHDKAGREWRGCRVAGFPRKRLLAWDLLYRALENIIGWRNK